jgi:uncharacterized membrane protein YhfC
MLLVNTGWFIGAAVSAVFVIVYPIVLAILANRRLKVSWRYFGYGALIFFLFQIITRVPAVIFIQRAIAPQLQASLPLRITWYIVLALTAGLFEEIGRYLGYRWLMRREEKTWSKAVMYGIGHGGLESMLLIGGQLLLALFNIVLISFAGFRILSAAQRIGVIEQFAAINAMPAWTALLGGWERLWAVPFHIAMSVIVLQVFRRQNMLWLWLAVLLHTILDSFSILLPAWLGPGVSTSLAVEGAVMIFGLGALWIIWRLRDHDVSTVAEIATPGEVPSNTMVVPDGQ